MELLGVSAIMLGCLVLLAEVTCLIQPIKMPDELSSCYSERTWNLSVTELPSQDINSFCINQYLWVTAGTRYHHEVSNETMSYIGALFRKVSGDHWNHRHKRQLSLSLFRRRRRELRTLSQQEWDDFVGRMNWLKMQTDVSPNRFDALASFHQGIASHSAHGGPNFYGWHRLYLLLVETALGVSIPYWDTSLDFKMIDPTRSIVWSRRYFGNGNGLVINGPFRGWQTFGVPLTRNIGSDGSLLSQRVINRVLSQIYGFQITEGSASPIFSLEGIHNGPHAWLDGAMGVSETSTADPVFYCLHAHIDYIWEQFRHKQRQYGINPARDYPQSSRIFHDRMRRVDGFPALTNIDCYSDFFGDLVQYEAPPSCPVCGNPYLFRCVRGECIPIENPELFPSQINSQIGYVPAEPSIVRNLLSQTGVRLTDPRVYSRGIQRRVQVPQIPFMSHLSGLLFRKRRSANKGERHKRSLGKASKKVKKILSDNNILFHKDYENTFVIDGVRDVDAWSFIPVKIIYQRPSKEASDQMQIDVLDKLLLDEDLELAKHEKCIISDNRTSRVYVQSDGVDYSGRYKDYAVVDETVTMSTKVTYVGIKNPDIGDVTAYITAYDSCGRACKPMCQVPHSNPMKYKPCSGTIRVSDELPQMYSPSLLDAVEEILSLDKKTISIIDTPIAFVCDYNIKWPWVLNK
ncbi:tyrosinase-like protein 2 [Mizuhopecten yessoensis]|uniref:Tyrosinase-like protein 2 n=1 Tax=Mizuhopecten yessoensis TaxID=6573 RepID=A0A210R239_MIZYE|nr:tyrosinase-like protein 2 [Mizuhopecten yessoensis]XP_021373709.1 tyrosinase-like protein 2 [Mizuhopecten yessoensis]OWF55150.1 Tyrosinase-like protein 2 [Mizuhopecten yessoensis]